MDTVKRYGPQIAVGVVAIAVSLYLINKNSQKTMAHVVVDPKQITGD